MGNQIWVGAGGAAFIRVYTSTRRGWGFSTTRFLYTIAGTGVTTRQGRENIVVTKSGRKVLPFQPAPKTPKRGLFFQSLPPRPPQPAVRALSEAEQQSAVAVDSLAVQLLMGETVEKAGQNAFFNREGRSKLLMVDSFMQEGKQQIIEDPAAFQAPELKNVFGGLPTILAQRAEAGLDKPLTVSGAPSTLNPGIVSVNNTDCMLCSVGPGATAEHMGGPDSCHVSDACGGTGSPAQALEKARAAAPAGFDLAGVPGLNGLPMVRAADGEAELPDIHLLWHELVVYCRSTDPTVPSSSITDTCLSANYVKDAVRAFLGPEHADDYQLAVASAGLHPVVKPLVEAEGLLPAAMQPAWNAECQGWTKFNVYMTANDAAVRDFLAQQWQAIVAEPDDLEATLLENSDRNAKVTPCSVAVKRVGGATYPSIKNMKGFKPLTSELAPVGPSVTLASDSAIAPVMEVAEGKEHIIFVQNFMKGSKISLQLVKGLDRSGPVVAAIDSFDDAVGPAGLTALKWTPPAGLKAMEKPGEINKYYLKASVDAFPAFFANSQAFTLAAAAGAAQ